MRRKWNTSLRPQYVEQFRTATYALRRLNQEAAELLRAVAISPFKKTEYNAIGERLTNFAQQIVLAIKHQQALLSGAHEKTTINVIIGTICGDCGNDFDEPRNEDTELLQIDHEHLAEIDLLLPLVQEAYRIVNNRYAFGASLPRAYFSGVDRLMRGVLLQRKHLLEIAPEQRIEIKVIEDPSDRCSQCGREIPQNTNPEGTEVASTIRDGFYRGD
jgi:hypothetical protein